MLPLAVLALERSLESGAAFPWPGRIGAALVAWACAHHLFAGIRHLLGDVGIGASLAASRKSAYAALIAAGAVGLAALLA
jgi:succinate dehydrogenase / fumarate reductase cytochrome b subunit